MKGEVSYNFLTLLPLLHAYASNIITNYNFYDFGKKRDNKYREEKQMHPTASFYINQK